MVTVPAHEVWGVGAGGSFHGAMSDVEGELMLYVHNGSWHTGVVSETLPFGMLRLELNKAGPVTTCADSYRLFLWDDAPESVPDEPWRNASKPHNVPYAFDLRQGDRWVRAQFLRFFDPRLPGLMLVCGEKSDLPIDLVHIESKRLAAAGCYVKQ